MKLTVPQEMLVERHFAYAREIFDKSLQSGITSTTDERKERDTGISSVL